VSIPSVACVFGVYLLLIPLFGAVYFWQYRRDRKRYAYASSVLHTQAAMFKERAEAKLIDTRQIIKALSPLRNRLGQPPSIELKEASKFNLFRGTWTAEFGGGNVTIYRSVAGSGIAGPSGITHEIIVRFDDGNNLSRSFTEGLSASVDLTRLIDLWFNAATSEASLLEEQLGTLDSDAPAVWTFLDFLYFSVITQTTVDYGDILPNCTMVRLLVSLQILLGYGLLVVAVNLVVGGV
jgi:hypothetical protein